MPPRWATRRRRCEDHRMAYTVVTSRDRPDLVDAAGGWGVPFAYNGRLDDLPVGYDAALVRAVQDHESGRTPTAFSFMAAAVNPAYDKKGLAGEVLSRLLERAAGLGHV